MSRHWQPRARSAPRPRRRRRTSFRVGGGAARLALLAILFVAAAYGLVPAEGIGTTGGGDIGNPSAVSVIDGDTFRYGGEKIRIADIDTPEVNGDCAYERRLAAQATDRLDALLRQGPFELHAVGRDEDRYGRKLRVVTRGGRSLGDQLVAEGLARTWTGRREPWC